MRKVEKTLIVFFIIAQLMRFFGISGGLPLSLIGGGALSALYLLFGFTLLSNVGAKKKAGRGGDRVSAGRIVLSIFSGLVLSFATVAAVFKLHFFGGANLLIDSAFILLILCMLVNFAFRFAYPAAGYKQAMARLIPYTTVCLVLVFAPAETLVKAYRRNDPDTARDLIKEKDKTLINERYAPLKQAPDNIKG